MAVEKGDCGKDRWKGKSEVKKKKKKMRVLALRRETAAVEVSGGC